MGKPERKDEYINIRISAEMKERLQERARRNRRSLANEFLQLVDLGIEYEIERSR
jgi:predicted DNA-binding protein